MKRFMFSLLAAMLLAVSVPMLSADDEAKPEAPKDEPATLEDCGKAVGGIWIGEEGIKDPKAPHGRFISEWGVNEKVCRSRTYWVQGGKEMQIYEGAQYWHPKRKELVFFEVSYQGELYDGTIVKRGEESVSKWTAYSDKGEVEYEQRGSYIDNDTMVSKVYYKKDGEWVHMRTYKFHRKPLDWKGDEPEKKDEK